MGLAPTNDLPGRGADHCSLRDLHDAGIPEGGLPTSLVVVLTEGLLTLRQWLISKGRNAEAKAMLTEYHANGLEGDPLVEWEYAAIVAVLHQETITPKSHYVSIRPQPPCLS